MTANTGQDSSFNQRFIRRIKPAILTIALTATALFGAISAASAQPATCDPKYWDSMKAKAWTEAQREIEQNQNYIYKSDSVLQYTCFSQFLNLLAGMLPICSVKATDGAPLLASIWRQHCKTLLAPALTVT